MCFGGVCSGTAHSGRSHVQVKIISLLQLLHSISGVQVVSRSLRRSRPSFRLAPTLEPALQFIILRASLQPPINLGSASAACRLLNFLVVDDAMPSSRPPGAGDCAGDSAGASTGASAGTSAASRIVHLSPSRLRPVRQRAKLLTTKTANTITFTSSQTQQARC